MTLVRQIEDAGVDFGQPISLAQMRVWMIAPDVDSRGAVHAMLAQEQIRRCITPPLPWDDYFKFVKDYLFRCLRENPDGDWASTRYEAGWELARWFSQLFYDERVPRADLDELQQELASLYRDADDELRHAIETATLEHVFEDKKLETLFRDWQNEEPLRRAYRTAQQWVEGGGKSSLVKK